MDVAEFKELIRSIEMSPMRKYGLKIFISNICKAYKMTFNREIVNEEMLFEYIYDELLPRNKQDGVFVCTIALMLQNLNVVKDILDEIIYETDIVV